tara:strand:- start:3286 stop:3492 length:207 start_codon:yes stop_codon:yes gene_type:complete
MVPQGGFEPPTCPLGGKINAFQRIPRNSKIKLKTISYCDSCSDMFLYIPVKAGNLVIPMVIPEEESNE